MVQLNPFHIVIQLAIFLSVATVLSRLVFRPILRLIGLREQRMTGDREEARKLVKQAEEQIKKYEDKIYQAKGEAKEIRAKMVHEANLVEREILGKAREDASKTMTRMRENALEEMRGERPRLEKDIAIFAKQMAETVMGRKIEDKGRENER